MYFNLAEISVINVVFVKKENRFTIGIVLFTKEGLGIRSTARILKISTTTLLKRIILIAKTINHPIVSKGKTYEVDEMCIYI